MAVSLSNLSLAKVVCALDTYNYTVINSGSHYVAVSVSVIPASGLSILIKLNGSTKATSTAPAAGQQIVNLATRLSCTANDTIAIVLSSSSVPEASPNEIKATLSIHQGSS